MSLTPRQRETIDKVAAYRAQHGGSIQGACNALGLNSATYGNAQRRLRFGPHWRYSGSGGHVVPTDGAGVASDREAFECEDEVELPF